MEQSSVEMRRHLRTVIASSNFERTAAAKTRPSGDFERTVATQAGPSSDLERTVASKARSEARGLEFSRFLQCFRGASRLRSPKALDALEAQNPRPRALGAEQNLSIDVYLYIRGHLWPFRP